jgi:prolyl-tRNA synthetase
LILPPEIAPVQVVIIPIIFKKGAKEVLAACKDVQERLKKMGIRAEIDASDLRPGAKYYKWEMKGVPLRLEIGPRDLQNNVAVAVRRDTGEKEQIPLPEIEAGVSSRFKAIHQNLYQKAKTELESRIFECEGLEEVKEKIQEGVATIPWCGNKECGLVMEEQIGAGILGIPLEQKKDRKEKCPVCGGETETRVYVARTY